MAEYAVIDFETANAQRGSACAVGVVRVAAGAVVKQWASLINPECEFAGINTMIHGLTAEDCASAPTFPLVYERIMETAQSCEVVVAHSAFFDMQVLAASAYRYGITMPETPFACTRVFARKWWPGWESYGLGYAVGRLGIADKLGGYMHHDALWDAAAAMHVAEDGLLQQGASSWQEAARMSGIHLGLAGGPGYLGCRTGGGSHRINPERRDDIELDEAHPLYGKRVCFTGTLSRFTRRDAAQLAVDAGAEFSPGVTRRTDLLVVGKQDLAVLNGHLASSKMRKAVELVRQGCPIEIIDEDDFYQLLSR